MNYEANKIKWKVGDLVLHNADAKRSEMLMKVIGYTRDGRCRTRYASPNQMNGDALRLQLSQKSEIWENGISVLHDPAFFSVNVVPPNDRTQRPAETRMHELIANRRFAEVRLLDALNWAAYAADIVRAVSWAQGKRETWHDATCSWQSLQEAIRRESGRSNVRDDPPEGARQ